MSGKLNKEEQVQVVIRLKPITKEHINTKSVYVSDQQDKTLVVETQNKKQYFVFDNIADEGCSQQEIYEYIGQDAVKSSTQGYNCCIFAYGQTGAGKTYSILGNAQDIINDIYAQSRGILPRLLSDLFAWYQNETNRFWIKCSYLEIYNEQIIDLLNPDLKLRQIREDFKRGVFIEGLSEENASNYQEAVDILMKGVKNRKVSATSMNDQSSRSHTIFTLNIESQILKDGITKTRRSKINIVDLAGSQRAKQTKVEGERLKEGCNINRSLHVLGNVINALVESTKKKKHIPFRDSKLTHFLKDSLSGNSITKLLANIHPSKSYLGDTISTLMFAKRAKILKMKVEVNENITQNFEELRKEIRKLREELAEARFIKNQSKIDDHINESQNESQSYEKKIDFSHFEIVNHGQALQVFEENELNYKALIQIYEEHMKSCKNSKEIQKKLNMNKQLKNIEKQNHSYKNLLKSMPAFTRIFKENIELKSRMQQKIIEKSPTTLQRQVQTYHKQKMTLISQQQMKTIKLQYENLIKQMQIKFKFYIQQLQHHYDELENDNRLKQEKIKELKKRKELPPGLEELTNQNQYLKLNILELEDEISMYEEKQRKLLIQIQQLKKENENEGGQNQQHPDIQFVTLKLNEVKAILDQETKQFEEERNSMLSYIDKLREKLIALIQENKIFTENIESLKQQNKGLKKKLHSLLKINNEMEITKDQNTYTNTFWTNEQSNISEQFEIFKNQSLFDKQQYSKNKSQNQVQEEKGKGIQLSNQIVKLHKFYNEEISKLREEITSLEKSRRELSQQNFEIISKLRKVESFEEGEEELHFKKQRLSKKQHSAEQLCRSSKITSKFKQPHLYQKAPKSSLKSSKSGGKLNEDAKI